MFNKDKFHNELAMRLGYERIVKDKRIDVEVMESDVLYVILKVRGVDEKIKINASGICEGFKNENDSLMNGEIKYIAAAIQYAYIVAERAF